VSMNPTTSVRQPRSQPPGGGGPTAPAAAALGPHHIPTPTRRKHGFDPHVDHEPPWFGLEPILSYFF
jgi:hypothetical protein